MTKSPHFWWIVSSLVLVIICLVSYIIIGRIDGAGLIVSYISCASVILSVTLSVFAILYTYTSNVQIQQQFEKINASATSIQEASSKLLTTEHKLNELLCNIEERLNNIDKSQQEMQRQITNMNTDVNNTQKISNVQN